MRDLKILVLLAPVTLNNNKVGDTKKYSFIFIC